MSSQSRGLILSLSQDEAARGTKAKTAPMTDDPQPLLDIVLRPHRSLSPAGFTAIMAALIAFSFVGGIVFFLAGAWPVIGFLGLDVALVYWAFRASYARGRDYERVVLLPGSLIIERVSRKSGSQTVELQPYWLRVDLEDGPEPAMRLLLRSHGKSTVLGGFLSPQERIALADLLREALARLRQSPSTSFMP
jgi:uncharacterized membrane protein